MNKGRNTDNYFKLNFCLNATQSEWNIELPLHLIDGNPCHEPTIQILRGEGFLNWTKNNSLFYVLSAVIYFFHTLPEAKYLYILCVELNIYFT